jgi:hypothetical protein
MHSVSLFHEAAQNLPAASDELAESQVSVKGAQLPLLLRSRNVHWLALVSRAMLAHICSKQINLSRTREEFFGFDRIPILQSASALCFCSAIVP